MHRHDHENSLLALLAETPGTRTVMGGTGAVKERVRRLRHSSEPVAGSCGGTTGGWGNSPDIE